MALADLRSRKAELLGSSTLGVTEYRLADREFESLRTLVYDLTGITLAENKRTMLEARLSRRVRTLGLPDFAAYCKLIDAQMPDGAEIRNMINAVTTNKTEFFRERHHFEFVKTNVLPKMSSTAALGLGARKLRVWHAGCSTGQEPYSLAMVISDFQALGPGWDVKLLASDIDTNVLQLARDGVYRADDISSVPPDFLRRHFLRGKGENDGKYLVKPALREMIAFRHINLLDDPWPLKPTSYFDIVFCRNVVIYFDKTTQRRLFQRFASRLNPGGYLFIGHSETLHGISEAFIPIGGTIYQKPVK
ncbi:MAG: protein-glutamate O-methyltransferase CheR [Capsulimonadaceae bacterium]|nr:protein-glutamate O-methyltransferase CheR [Capsulimonadaceae bacterium]